MGRPPRIIFEGAIYHVIMRGNNQDFIFNNPRHKSFILKQLGECRKVLDFELLAYVIMNNHYHLVIKANKNSISEVMFCINNVLGKYLSRELNRTGHIFEKRYTCKLITNNAYLVWVVRYIHRNPIRAGICKNIDDYSWSSHYFYKRGINTFVNTDYVLNLLSPTIPESKKRYLDLVYFHGDDSNPELDLQAAQLQYCFTDLMLEDETKPVLSEIPLIQNKRKSLEDIFNSLSLEEDIKSLLLTSSRKVFLTDYKLIFIKEALRNKYTLKEISTFLNVTSTSVSMLLSRHKVSICDL